MGCNANLPFQSLREQYGRTQMDTQSISHWTQVSRDHQLVLRNGHRKTQPGVQTSPVHGKTDWKLG